MKVQHVKQIHGHPVVSPLSRGQAEVGEYGCWCPSLHWEQNAFYLQSESGEIVAALAYHKIESQSCYWIDMGYVVMEFRRTGLYRELYDALVAKARAEGVRTVEGEVAISNKPMMAAAKAQGRTAMSTRWVTRLSDDG